MRILADIDGFTFVPIHAIIKFEIACGGRFFEDTVNDCDTKDEFTSLYGECGGYAELVAYTAVTSIRLFRVPITPHNFKTFKDSLRVQLNELLRNLGE